MIPFKNYTRYRTTDLETIIERVATSIAELTGEPAKMVSRIQRLEFHEYTPSDPVETYRTWDAEKSSYKTHARRKFVGHVAHTRPERIPLLHPRLIWENPLAALTSGTDGEERAPDEMVKRVAEVVRHSFDFDAWKYSREGRPLEIDIEGLILRIEKKTAAKVGAAEKKREKLRLALRSINTGYYDIRSSLHHLAKFIDAMEMANNYDSTPELVNQLRVARSAYVELANLRDLGNKLITDDLKARREALGDTSEEA